MTHQQQRAAGDYGEHCDGADTERGEYSDARFGRGTLTVSGGTVNAGILKLVSGGGLSTYAMHVTGGNVNCGSLIIGGGDVDVGFSGGEFGR